MQGRTGKIVLAVLGVILMIVFILPASMQSLPGSDPTVGMIGDEPVRQSDIYYSSQLFDYASNDLLVPMGNGQYASLTAVIFQNYADRLAEDPELFHLLIEEADRSGATMPREPLESQLTMGGVEVVIRDRSAPGGQRRVPFADLPGEQMRAQVLAAAGPILSIDRSLGMYADYARVSAPLVDYFIAIQSQRADMRTVVFDSEQYLDRAPEPTPEQTAAHFEKYKDNLAERTTPDNPFGFGYRLPDRVKLQYITISRDAIREHVIAGLAQRPIAAREEEIYLYWSENRARFPAPPATTQPATGPATSLAPGDDPEAAAAEGGMAPADDVAATQPATAPATQPVRPEQPLLSTNPEVRQFLDSQAASAAGKEGEADWQAYMAVHDQVVERFVSQKASELQANISKRLRDTLTSDFRAFDLSSATTRPRTRVGTPVDDLEYLDRVADAIATELGVRPRVSSYARDYLTYEQMQDEKLIGEIAMAFAPMELQLAIFGNYVFGSLLELLDEESRQRVESSGAGLRLFQPSQPLSDLGGNEHVFRVTEALPDAAPASLAEVEEKVRQDLRRHAAYELALAQAESFVERARTEGLDAAAQAAGFVVHDPVAFAPGAGIADVRALGAKGEDENLTVAARSDLADSFYRMITDPALADVEKPIAALPMRPAFRVIVAELEDLLAGWIDEAGISSLREQRQQEFRQQLTRIASPADDFFSFEKAAQRVGYVPEQPRKAGVATTQPDVR